VLALSLTLALSSHANSAPASRASLEALFQLIRADSMIDSVYAAMYKSVSQLFAQDARQRGASVARQQIEAKAMSDMMALVRSKYNWTVIEPDMIDAYQKTFSEDEITAMINFYATPAGQAAITKLPQLMQSMMAGSHASAASTYPGDRREGACRCGCR